MRSSAPRAFILIGLAIATIGLLVAWWSAGGPGSGIPPGLAILPIALLVAILVRGAWGSGLTLLIVLVMFAGVVGGEPRAELFGNGGMAAGVGRWLQVGGLLLAAAASAAGIRAERTFRDPVLRKAPLHPERTGRWRLVVLLLVLAPVCAEYLAAYDASTGNPLELLGGLLIFVPLYGAPALLIREIGRRIGMSWPGMLLLATAFGVMQAGVVDQSLFSASYRGLEEWETMRGQSYLPALGFSLHQLLSFVGGHMIYSFGAPIALVEALRPGVRREPWLGGWGVFIAAAGYGLAASLVLRDHLATEAYHASTMQLVGSVAAIIVLLAAAFVTIGRVRRQVERRAPSPALVLAAAFAAASALTLLPEGWAGSAAAALLMVMTGWGLLAWSRRRGWGIPQEVAVASGFLMSRALLAFTYFPLFGEVEPHPKYLHNAAMLAGVGVICVLAYRRATRHPGAATGR